MNQNTINPTEWTFMLLEQANMQQKLTKSVISIDPIDYRRLAYFLIETRRATVMRVHCPLFLALFAFGDYAARGDSLLRAAACYQ